MTSLHRLAACADCGRQFDVSGTPELAALGPGGSFPCSCGGTVRVPDGRAEDAAVVACSSCGAPRQGGEAAGAADCAFCGSTFTLRERDLDAICPRCMARVSRRGRFCHHCALPLTAPVEAVVAGAGPHTCPACAPQPGGGEGAARPLVSRRIGREDPLHLFECDACAGVWLDREVFRALVERARRGRANVPGLPPRPPGAAGAENDSADAPGRWRYRPCAVCGNLMQRRNYGRRSGVILDLCGDHGLWFDADELHRVLAWVKSGGATQGEVVEAEREREERRRRAAAGGGSVLGAPFPSGPSGGSYRRGFGDLSGSLLVEGLAWLVDALVDTRWR